MNTEGESWVKPLVLSLLHITDIAVNFNGSKLSGSGVESPESQQQERYISVIEIGFSSNKSMRSSITLGFRLV